MGGGGCKLNHAKRRYICPLSWLVVTVFDIGRRYSGKRSVERQPPGERSSSSPFFLTVDKSVHFLTVTDSRPLEPSLSFFFFSPPHAYMNDPDADKPGRNIYIGGSASVLDRICLNYFISRDFLLSISRSGHTSARKSDRRRANTRDKPFPDHSAVHHGKYYFRVLSKCVATRSK